jgi:transcriptional regulator with XRE-family HTH domain
MMLTVVRDQDAVQEHLEELGSALRDARLKLNLTQGEVGEQAGVSRQLVSRIEQGLNGEISAYLAVAAAVGLRIAVSEDMKPADAEKGPGRLF